MHLPRAPWYRTCSVLHPPLVSTKLKQGEPAGDLLSQSVSLGDEAQIGPEEPNVRVASRRANLILNSGALAGVS